MMLLERCGSSSLRSIRRPFGGNPLLIISILLIVNIINDIINIINSINIINIKLK